MTEPNRKKDPINDIDALLEKTAKKVEKAAKACRLQGGGPTCLELDVDAAYIRNARGLGEQRARALAAKGIHPNRLDGAAGVDVTPAPAPTPSVGGASASMAPPAVTAPAAPSPITEPSAYP